MDTTSSYIDMWVAAKGLHEKANLLADRASWSIQWQLSRGRCKEHGEQHGFYCSQCGKKLSGQPPQWVPIAGGSIGQSFNSIILPRQDQLQEIVGFTSRNIGAFYRWASSEIYDLPSDKEKYSLPGEEHWYRNIPEYFNGSWEQLWLAFLKHELHQEVWNGTEWVNE